MADPSTATEARLRELEQGLESMEDELRGMRELLQESAGEQDTDEPKFAPFYPSVQEWVQGHFAQVYVRNLEMPGLHWCTRWWEHDEAAIRLIYLWEVWELTRDKRGSAAWWNALDHHLPILLSEQGPFGGCSSNGHHPFPALPVELPPAGWPETGDEPS